MSPLLVGVVVASCCGPGGLYDGTWMPGMPMPSQQELQRREEKRQQAQERLRQQLERLKQQQEK